MALADDLIEYARTTFASGWTTRAGQVVPEPKDLKSSNDAIQFDRATVLYADLSGSTSMVDKKYWEKSAEIYKNVLYCAARLITDSGGTITAYDGDRVMGVFVGNYQSSPAAMCALKINYAAQFIINPAFKKQYPDDDFVLRHVVGIDTSLIRVAKTGVRGDNDLVWVGRSANYAAKLTELPADYSSWITADVFNHLTDDVKFSGNLRTPMWEKRLWTAMNNMEVYCSTYWWKV